MREVISGKGSRFLLCQLSQQDRRFPKYPPQPVMACGGFRSLPDPPSSVMKPQLLRQPLVSQSAKTMKIGGKTGVDEDDTHASEQIVAYTEAQPLRFREMCVVLRDLVDKALPNATSKVWHGSPVWFIEDNPVVGYTATAKTVNLLFWNGQAFDEPALKPVGKYRAAHAVFTDANDINAIDVRRWLKKAKADVFDSKSFFAKMRRQQVSRPG